MIYKYSADHKLRPNLSLFTQSPEEVDSIVSRLDENTELRNKTSKSSQSELSEPLQKLL